MPFVVVVVSVVVVAAFNPRRNEIRAQTFQFLYAARHETRKSDSIFQQFGVADGWVTDRGALTFHRHRLTPAMMPCCKFFRISHPAACHLSGEGRREKLKNKNSLLPYCLQVCVCVRDCVCVSHLLASQILFSFWSLSICVIFFICV